MMSTSRSAASFVLVLLLSLGHPTTVCANTFLRAHAQPGNDEQVSAAEVERSLLEEIEGALGTGTASLRVDRLEERLAPMFASMPKNEHGRLEHAATSYALRRLFAQLHGWSLRGLDPASSGSTTWSSSTPAAILKSEAPAYVEHLFEQRQGGRGLGLHELAVMGATIEHLIHSELVGRLGEAYRLHKTHPIESLQGPMAEQVLDTFIMGHLLGENLTALAPQEAQTLVDEMPEISEQWLDMQAFVRRALKEVVSPDPHAGVAAADGIASVEFGAMAKAAEKVGEHFGAVQNEECRKMKKGLVELGGSTVSSGRVSLADFYRPAVTGGWHFSESVEYMRQLGALDESEQPPRVLVTNYLYAASNCVASSSYYSVCCIDECEGLLSEIEGQVAAPEATTARVAGIVASLSSSSTSARNVSGSLLERLDEIAVHHGGTVPLHGRLFAQWMHYAFPLECSFPHLSGSISPQLPDDWESSGKEVMATREEMRLYVDAVGSPMRFGAEGTQEASDAEIPLWSPEEELLVLKSPPPTMAPHHAHWKHYPLLALLAGSLLAIVLAGLFGATAMRSGESKDFKLLV